MWASATWQHHNLRLATSRALRTTWRSLVTTPPLSTSRTASTSAGTRRSRSARATACLKTSWRDAGRTVARSSGGKNAARRCFTRVAGAEGERRGLGTHPPLQKKDEFVMKMVRNFDEKLKAMHSGMDLRPLTKKRCGCISPSSASTKIWRWARSSACRRAKVRLVLAAAMWINPHIIALDENHELPGQRHAAALTKAL